VISHPWPRPPRPAPGTAILLFCSVQCLRVAGHVDQPPPTHQRSRLVLMPVPQLPPPSPLTPCVCLVCCCESEQSDMMGACPVGARPVREEAGRRRGRKTPLPVTTCLPHRNTRSSRPSLQATPSSTPMAILHSWRCRCVSRSHRLPAQPHAVGVVGWHMDGTSHYDPTAFNDWHRCCK
jgi:hypothetical protein